MEIKSTSTQVNNINNTETILTKPKSSNSYWPTLTVAAGVMAGSAYNLVTNQSLDTKIGVACDLMRKSAPLKLINLWKQTEIKSFALASPLVIGLCYEGYRYLNTKNDKEQKPVSPANTLPYANLVKSVALTGLMIGANQLALAYGGNYLPEDFKISGHIMLKGATTYATVKLLNHLQDTGSPALAKVCGGVIAVTDALFLGNTAACYHTVKEVVAGAMIVGAAAEAVERVTEPLYSAISNRVKQLV